MRKCIGFLFIFIVSIGNHALADDKLLRAVLTIKNSVSSGVTSAELSKQLASLKTEIDMQKAMRTKVSMTAVDRLADVTGATIDIWGGKYFETLYTCDKYAKIDRISRDSLAECQAVLERFYRVLSPSENLVNVIVSSQKSGVSQNTAIDIGLREIGKASVAAVKDLTAPGK